MTEKKTIMDKMMLCFLSSALAGVVAWVALVKFMTKMISE